MLKYRILNRALLLMLFSQFASGILYSQNSYKFFITYDPFKAIINEHSIALGYNRNPHHLIEFSLGYMYANKSLRESIIGFSPSQDKYPVLVNTGPVVRGGYEYKVKPFFYFGADVCYKYLQYSNHEFQDSNGKDASVWYTRDEKSNVLAGHVNIGFLLNISKTPIVFKPSIGIGGKIKFRNYTTYNVEKSSDGSFDIYPGTFSKKQGDLSIIVNMNIGITIGR
jgi:hypothetical protein